MVHKPTGFDIRIFAGSACFWAWLDAMFMSTFFPAERAGGFMPEMVSVLVFAVSGLVFAAALARPARIVPLLAGRKLPLASAILVLLSFGFLQHVTPFSAVANIGFTSGVFIQLIRGAVAIIAFLIVIFAPARTVPLYKVGLLAMIAGFMLMALFFGTPSFGIAGAVIMGGYTVFDLLLWVLSSQIAKTRSASPLRTVALVRLIAVVCYVIGVAAAMVLVGNGPKPDAYVFQETIIIGYLVVIATVLLLSTKDMWELWGMGAETAPSSEEERRERLGQWFASIGLTPREQEVAVLLAAGRTQPWIAENLCISENTVGSHVRHIYQKAEVHDRQQFIDLVTSPENSLSPDSREGR